MTRSQVYEGFRRIGQVLGYICALACAVIVFILASPWHPGGTWWNAIMWIAITAPIAEWCGSRSAHLVGWLIMGFLPPPLVVPSAAAGPCGDVSTVSLSSRGAAPAKSAVPGSSNWTIATTSPFTCDL